MAIKASRKPSRPDEYLAGIPNRSLETEEFDALSKEDQERVESSGLYSMRGGDAPARPAAPVSPPASGAKDGD